MGVAIERRLIVVIGEISGQGWREEVHLLPQVLINIPVTDKNAVMADPRVQELVEVFNEQYQEQGRVLIRPSGTEAKIRVMVEMTEGADDQAADLAKKIAVLAG